MKAADLKHLIEAGEAKLDRVKAEAQVLPHGTRRKHLEHLINGAAGGIRDLKIQLAGMEEQA